MDNNINTDELSFVVNNVNPTNVDIYREVYAIGVEARSSFLNNRVVALMNISNDCDPSFVSLHINTVFLEFLRNTLIEKGIVVSVTTTLIEALSIYNKIVEISENPDLISCLQEVPVSSCDLLDISNKLGIDLSLDILNIDSYTDYIKNTYRNNKEFVYRDISEPLDIPAIP